MLKSNICHELYEKHWNGAGHNNSNTSKINLIFIFSYENTENNVVEAAQACRPQYCHSYKLLYCDNKLNTIVLQDLLVSKMIYLGGVKLYVLSGIWWAFFSAYGSASFQGNIKKLPLIIH